MKIADRVKIILERLDEHYGTDYRCSLDHDSAWQLLIATMLSAQCTDARVNIVTKELFVKYPNVNAFADADLKELEQDIHSTGFYHNKAKNIIACCQALRDKYDGQVPRSLEDLTSLAGVGRKTANVIRGNIYHDPSIVVDTHVKRMKKLPKDHWILCNIHLITFGREICKAPAPKCEECFLRDVCADYEARMRKQRKVKPLK